MKNKYTEYTINSDAPFQSSDYYLREEHSSSYQKSITINNITLVAIIFWLLFLLIIMMRPLYNSLIYKVLNPSSDSLMFNIFNLKIEYLIKMRTEYNLYEQLSRLYIFIVIIVSIYSYSVLDVLNRVKTSIGFFLLGFILYLSESNMITDSVRPLFVFIIFSYILYLLLSSRSWYIISLMIMGFIFMMFGFLADLAHCIHMHPSHQSDFIRSLWPQPIKDFFLVAWPFEEIFEVAGLGFVCLASISNNLDVMKQFVKNNFICTSIILIASAMIVMGNGFSHWEYKPVLRLQIGALILTIIGICGLFLAYTHILRKKNNLTALSNESLFYSFIIFVFLLLPSVYSNISDVKSLVLWFPLISLFGLYLYSHHPLIGQTKR